MTAPPYAAAESPNSDFQFDGLKVIVLAGGVGGAKLAEGMAQVVPAENLTIVVNTGDDFQHLGLTLCPDLDTVLYTLAGVANHETGWGRDGESWRTIAEINRLGGPDWFKLGDLDLATHLVRSEMLSRGSNLTDVTRHLCQHFGVDIEVLPMSDGAAPTMVETGDGLLPFQTWFVAERWQPAVRQIQLPEDVRATPPLLAALEKADVVIIAPSNPFVSIDPILNVYPIREMIQDLPELVLAVSPIIAGQAVKGPAAKMMAELGMEVSSQAVAEYYGEMIDAFVHDERDGAPLNLPDVVALQSNTLMVSRAGRRVLAENTLRFASELLEG
jgi:LPPG:FO 2-phospho-L-lactate transferase